MLLRKRYSIIIIIIVNQALSSIPLGYDSMGFDLSKPRMRAELEIDLKRYGVISRIIVVSLPCVQLTIHFNLS